MIITLRFDEVVIRVIFEAIDGIKNIVEHTNDLSEVVDCWRSLSSHFRPSILNKVKHNSKLNTITRGIIYKFFYLFECRTLMNEIGEL